MAIAKMKRLHLIALQSDRRELMARMLHLGCVHLAEPTEVPEDLALRRDTSQLADRQAKLRTLRTAQAALQQWAPVKGGLLTPRPQVKESEFLDDRLLEWQLRVAEEVNGHTAEIERLRAVEARLRTEQMTLLPWRELDIPLELTDTRTARVMTGTLPTAVSWEAVQGELSEQANTAQLSLLGQTKEQNCVLLICHKEELDAALEVLRGRGFAVSQLSGMSGTVGDNLQRLEGRLAECESKIQEERRRCWPWAASRPDSSRALTAWPWRCSGKRTGNGC